MTEEFLQYIWEAKLFKSTDLQTTNGEKIEILDVGKRNHNSGPDFFNAKVKIGETIWAGNIEIHKNSGDWKKHNHQLDKFYDSVILHVVETDDEPVLRSNNEFIPTLIIRYLEYLRSNYEFLLKSNNWIPCQNQLHKFNPVLLQIGFNRLMVERLEDKTAEIV